MKTTTLSNIYRLILLLSLFFLFSQADCSRKNDLPVVYLSQEFKDYAVFKKGTFWIYQNNMGETDTVSITTYESWVTSDDFMVYDIVKMNKYSTIKNKTTKLISDLADNKTKIINNKCSDINWLKDIYHNTYFLCCCEIGSQKGGLEYIDFIDSLNINGKEYYSIKVFENVSFSNETYVTTYFYYVKNFGLIKKEQPGVFNWELIDYYIIQ